MLKMGEIRKHLQEQAHVHRGVFLAGPPLFAATTVFLNPICGFAGFILNFLICPPKGKVFLSLWLLAYPMLIGIFAYQNPRFSEASIPWHKSFVEPDGIHFFMGEVAGFPVSSERTFSFPFDTDQGIFRVSLPLSISPPPWGAKVVLLGKIMRADPVMNPGQADPQRILHAQGALAFLKAASWTLIDPPNFWKNGLGNLRHVLKQSLEKHVPAPALGLVEAALLNETEGVTSATKDAFLRSGMQHILAISGQHIGLLFAFLLLGAVCLRLPRKAAYVAACLVAAAYIPTVGAPISVVRAGYMVAFLLPCVLLERPNSGLHAFSMTLAFDLITNPHYVLNLGFQLSYAATLALILCSKPAGEFAELFGRCHSFLKAGLQMVFFSVMVTVFTFPALAASTHAMAPWGILGNLVAIPIGAAMLISGFCAWTFSPLPILADWAGSCSALFSILLESCVHFLSRLPGALASIADPHPYWVAFLSLAALGCAAIFRLWGLRPGFIFTVLLISLEFLRPHLCAPKPGESRMTFLSVGHGDAAVLELPGAVFLIDAGPDPETAKRIILPFLRSRGISRIDALVLTHPDLDHYGGLPGLMAGMTIDKVFAPSTVLGSSPIWDCLRSSCHRRGIKWFESQAGDRLYRGKEMDLQVLGPNETLKGAGDNNRSLVCLFTNPKEKVLFTGDIEGPGQNALAESWPLWKGAWLKAPHHGSDRTTLPCFLEAVHAPVASISAGRRPGFPGPHTMETLRQMGTKAGVTSRDGALFWRFSPSSEGEFWGFHSNPM